MTHSLDTIARLSFVRYLYQLALTQGEQPEPLSASALLTLHDSIELYLDLACEVMNVKPPVRFMEYWDCLEPKVAGGLGHKEPMRRLNKARVNLKHHGAFPSRLVLTAATREATDFLSSSSPKIFGVAFEDVSLIDFVPSENAKAELVKFREHRDAGRFFEATAALAIGFEQLLYDYEDSKQYGGRRSAFTLLPTFGLSSSGSLGLSLSGRTPAPERRMAEFVDAVGSTFQAVERAIKLIALGVDYRRYTRFRSLTPTAMRTMAGTYNVDGPLHMAEHRYTTEELDFCFDFVVQTGLALVEFDYRLIPEMSGEGRT
jgi:hypothetical protein